MINLRHARQLIRFHVSACERGCAVPVLVELLEAALDEIEELRALEVPERGESTEEWLKRRKRAANGAVPHVNLPVGKRVHHEGELL